MSEKVHGVITQPVLEEISKDIKIISGLEVGKIPLEMLEDLRVVRAQMEVGDQVDQDAFSKVFGIGNKMGPLASWRTRSISLPFATPLIRTMAWDSKSTIV